MVPKKLKTLQTAFNTYEIQELLGEGGAGRVYSVIDTSECIYAAKVLKAGQSSKKRKRFKNEIDFCAHNKHKNIIRVVDYGVINYDNPAPFYIMPYYPTNLRELMRQGIQRDQVLVFFSQILNGIEAAHLQSVWHRDMKPENILYDEENDQLLVADFGIAHFAEEVLQTLVETSPQERLANFQYAAPEQRSKGRVVDHLADIYALGLILNELFTNEVPQGSGYKKIGSVTPVFAYLDDVVDKMIRQMPDERLASIAIIKEELNRRGEVFFSAQKVSELKDTVIPESEIDDPLFDNAVKLINIQDYHDDNLYLKLNQEVTKEWIEVFNDTRTHRATGVGQEPTRFKFQGDITSIPTNERDVQRVVDYLKKYLENTHKAYKLEVLRKKERREIEERERLKKERGQEEARLRILNNTNI